MCSDAHSITLRKITKSRKSIPAYMLYTELGRYTLKVTFQTKMFKFKCTHIHLLNCAATIIICCLYVCCYSNVTNGNKWILYCIVLVISDYVYMYRIFSCKFIYRFVIDLLCGKRSTVC